MFGSLSLVHGVLPIAIVVLAITSLVLLLAPRNRVWTRQLMIAVPVTVLVTGLVVVLVRAFSLIPYAFPDSFYVWFGLIVLSITLAIAGWRRFGIGRRVISGVALVLTIAMTLTLINGHYAYYPTVKSLFGVDAHHISQQQLAANAAETAAEARAAAAANAQQRAAARAALEQARIKAAGGHPMAAVRGATIQTPIPGAVSGFKARDAYIWLPPAWFTDPMKQLPVIELIAGAPGAPSDWIQGGLADQTASRFAQAHDGVAPIIVMPDSNGSDFTDTECVNSSLGNAETYLTVDVPAYVRTAFDASRAADSMAIGGLSAGGMCATMLALRHPTLYGTFADYAGLTSPTVGESVDPDATTQALFDGSSTAYQQHDPLYLLANNRYPHLAGWFEVGTDDGGPLAAQQTLVPLAQQAGITTQAVEVPGGTHSFALFAQAFADSLPFLSYRLGLTAAPAPVANQG